MLQAFRTAIKKGDDISEFTSLNITNMLDEYGKAPLHYALEAENENIAAQLIEAGADITLGDASDWTPLHQLAHQNKSELLLLAEKKSPSINLNVISCKGQTPLMIAAQFGSLSMANLLIRMGADKNLLDNDDKSAQQYAIENDQLECVKLLFDSNYIFHGNTIIHLAVKYEAEKVTEYFYDVLKNSTLLYQKNRKNLTPLQLASKNAHHSIAMTLLGLRKANGFESLQLVALKQLPSDAQEAIPYLNLVEAQQYLNQEKLWIELSRHIGRDVKEIPTAVGSKNKRFANMQ